VAAATPLADSGRATHKELLETVVLTGTGFYGGFFATSPLF